MPPPRKTAAQRAAFENELQAERRASEYVEGHKELLIHLYKKGKNLAPLFDSICALKRPVNIIDFLFLLKSSENLSVEMNPSLAEQLLAARPKN